MRTRLNRPVFDRQLPQAHRRRLPGRGIHSSRPKCCATRATLYVVATLVATTGALAQGQPGAGGSGPRGTVASSARAQAPFDLTGYWVSLVTEDWSYRMVVPGKGEYAGIPLNFRAKQFADAWDAAADTTAGKQCEAYGAAALMRIPERLHIDWQNPNTLTVQTDAGMQARLLHFSATSPGAPSWQGYSEAKWMLYRLAPSAGGPPPARGSVPQRSGSLSVVTTNLLPGLLRKNGVPYSDRTTVQEYWDVYDGPSGTAYLAITPMVNDPVYLIATYTTTEVYARETGQSLWHPSACTLTTTP